MILDADLGYLLRRAAVTTLPSTQLAQTISQIDGVGDVERRRELPARGARDSNPQALFNQWRIAGRRAHPPSATPTSANRRGD